MKRLLLLLTVTLMLVACSTESQQTVKETKEETQQEDVITTVSESEHDITLIDNDELKIKLKETKQTVNESTGTNELELAVDIKNKTNKTIDMYINELLVDGTEVDDMKTYFYDGELKPNESKSTYIYSTVYEHDVDESVSMKEHIKGEITYSDYDGNRFKERFSEYINNQEDDENGS